MNIISTNQLCKKYGSKLVIDHVNMHIPEKAIYGFVGENGSGKTTIMRLLTGLAEVTSGSYTLFGIENTNRKIYQAREKISAIVETTSLIPTMTAIDNIRYQESFLGIKLTNEERNDLLKRVHLDEVGNKKVKNFSLGMRQRLGIALAIINKPKLMLLDEPMNGLDPEGIAELRDLLIDLNQKDGISVLISSHILSELEKIASCYGFISRGRILEEISADELQNRCRKSIDVKVDDLTKGEAAIKELKIDDYKVSSNGEIKIYNNVEINDLLLAFASKGIKILSIKSNDESVEEYYLNLIKEAK